MTGNPYDPQPDDQRPEDASGQKPDQPQVDLSKGGSYNPPPSPHSPYGQQQPYGQPFAGQAPYGQSPYGQQQPYGQTPYGQAPYGQPYGPTPYGQQKEGSATTSMVLGIVAVGGLFICGITILLSPVALIMGLNSKRRIDASGGQLSGRGEAQAGFVLGIIGTVLLVLGIIAIVALIVVAATSDGGSSYDSYDNGHYNALAPAFPVS